MRQIPAGTPDPTARGPQFAARHENLALREMREAPIVIGVQMSEHDMLHITWRKADGA
jgi:hypothetical protein